MNEPFQFPQTVCYTRRGCLDNVALLTNRDGVARNCQSAMLTGNGSAHVVNLDELKRIAGKHVTVHTDNDGYDDDVTFSFKQMTDDEWQAMLDAVQRDYLSEPRTYLMRWNPAISSVKIADYDKAVVESEAWMPRYWNWSIWEHEDAMRGDRYFMLREGDGIAPGIYYAGDFISDPWTGEDWRGTGKQRYYVDMDREYARLAEKGPWLTTEELEAAIPSVNWRIGHSGELLTPEVAAKLQQMWQRAVDSAPEVEEDDTEVAEVEQSDLDEAECLAEALYIMRDVHCNQKDKAGKPYILHPLRVAHNCQTLEQKTVALLHDVIEDSTFTAEDLYDSMFPKNIVEAVEALTRNEAESYDDFIERCATNPLARYVKIRDLRDNLDVTCLENLDAAAAERINKYLRALRRLE